MTPVSSYRSLPLVCQSTIRACHRVPHRSFSSSRVQQNAFIDATVAGPMALLNGIHSLGLPYYATIPVAAVLVRGLFVHYLSVLPSRRDAEIRAQLAPLLSIRQVVHYRDRQQIRKGKDLMKRDPSGFYRRLNMLWTRSKLMSKLHKESGTRSVWWGVSFNIAILYTFAETVRMKCGLQSGLLGMAASTLTSRFNPSGAQADARAEKLADLLMERRDTLVAQSSSMTESELAQATMELQRSVAAESSRSGPDITSPFFDPLLQTEGLSWCPDLTVADPTYVLPIMLSLAILTRGLLRPTSNPIVGLPESHIRKGTPIPPVPKSWRLTLRSRLDILMAILIPMLLMNAPAAIMLYLIPSTLTGWVQGRWLDFKSPLPPSIPPCKRPLRIKVTLSSRPKAFT